jgi:hypothetical protein
MKRSPGEGHLVEARIHDGEQGATCSLRQLEDHHLRASPSDVDARRVAIARELDVIAGRDHRLLDALADGDMPAGAIRERLKSESETTLISQSVTHAMIFTA